MAFVYRAERNFDCV